MLAQVCRTPVAHRLFEALLYVAQAHPGQGQGQGQGVQITNSNFSFRGVDHSHHGNYIR